MDLCAELKKYYGPDAEFRVGQKEAILDVLDKKRILVVQKTGWGKSLVYFLATKVIREQTKGITLIISPLLALMNNQIDAAGKIGLHVMTINSENSRDSEQIFEEIRQNRVDALIISPERLANDDFKSQLINCMSGQIGLFVVDEAHCISDWGHDFRPDYRRIVDILRLLPSNIPVLATTATANNRVVNDIRAQLGGDLIIRRGNLVREGLAIQVIHLDSKEERLAWLSEHLKKEIPGTGIVYCLTVNDCLLVESWLKKNGISCESFYSSVESEKKAEIVDHFMKNKIKVLAATVAFGMGFDKADISFVIHFQRPANLVAYYQQIGRAGRAIDRAYAILLCGKEDNEINQYFINSAFPTEQSMNEIIKLLTKNNQGLKAGEIQQYIDMNSTTVDKCLKYLLVNGDIYKENGRYHKSIRPWKPDLDKSKKITAIRNSELKQMEDFTHTSDCYMKYIATALDDENPENCGCCANCLRKNLFGADVSPTITAEAQNHIRSNHNVITPRKKWPSGINSGKLIPENRLCGEGLVLSNYGDAGWGKRVADCKYKTGAFDDDLVDASAKLLREFVREQEIEWVTSVPSRRRPTLVRDFARKVAERLNLPYQDAIEKAVDNKCQKEFNASYFQCQNAYQSFQVTKAYKGNVLLIDDMVDSKWTFTVCGFKLREQGSGKVFPFALANTGGSSAP